MVQPLPKMQSNPLAAIQAFTQPRRNQLAGLASGLLSSPNFGQGLSAGFAQAAQGRQVDDAYAVSQREAADRQAKLEKTISYLRTQPGGATWAEALGAGMIDDPRDAFKGWYEESKPKGPIKASAGDVFLDPDTFQPISSVPDPKAAMAADKEAFDRESGLAKEYAAADPVNTYEAVKGGYQRVRQGAMQDNGAGDMAVIYGFMKMNDPTSVVRESEFEMAAKTGSLPEQFQGLVNQVLTGGRLNPEVRARMVEAAEGLYQETADDLGGINSQFTERATGFGVKPERFIRQPEVFEPLKPKSTPGGGVVGTTSTGVGWSFN